MGLAPLGSDVTDTRAMLESAAVMHGDIEAYVEPGARITFAEWIGRARGVATQFADLGVGKGDVVTLWLPSGIDYATCYAAAAMIGAVTTGLNPRLGRSKSHQFCSKRIQCWSSPMSVSVRYPTPGICCCRGTRCAARPRARRRRRWS